jgi:hypothetical protein
MGEGKRKNMSFDALLIHTCTIEPAKAGTLGAHGNKTPAWDTPVQNVRCRLVEARERVWSDERGESVIQSVYKLYTMADSALGERARVTKITLEDGTTVNDTFVVTELFVRRGRNSHHKMATMERIS